MGHSNTPQLFRSWKYRWIELHDSFISIRRDIQDDALQGVLSIDAGMETWAIGRYITVKTLSRKLTLRAPNVRIAKEWREAIVEFYNTSSRCQGGPHKASFSPRTSDVTAYGTSSDFLFSVAVALLSATHEVFIACASLNLDIYITRPPLPPIRLDHLLRLRALAGVRVYVLINREVLGIYF